MIDELVISLGELVGELVVRNIANHIVILLRTSWGQVISVTAYRDVPAMLGREAPIVWARSGDVFVQVQGYARPAAASDGWSDGLLDHVLATTPPLPEPDEPDVLGTLVNRLESHGIAARAHTHGIVINRHGAERLAGALDDLKLLEERGAV